MVNLGIRKRLKQCQYTDIVLKKFGVTDSVTHWLDSSPMSIHYIPLSPLFWNVYIYIYNNQYFINMPWISPFYPLCIPHSTMIHHHFWPNEPPWGPHRHPAGPTSLSTAPAPATAGWGMAAPGRRVARVVKTGRHRAWAIHGAMWIENIPGY